VTDEEKPSAAGQTSTKTPVAEDAGDAAAGLRGTARWIASAFAAIPSLTILATLLKAPEGETFNHERLFWALFFAALGVLIGITAFARVLRPGSATKSDLDGFDMSRVSNSPFRTIDDLRNATLGFRDAVADKGISVADLEADSERAKAASKEATAALELVEKQLKESPTDAGLQALAATKRQEWSAASTKAAVASGAAASAARSLKETEEQLEAREGLLTDVYGLKTSDLVADRYGTAVIAAWFAVASVGLGLFLLMTSTVDKTPFEATLVKLSLEKAGKDLLGCPQTTTVYGIQVAKTKDGPRVITLPQADCASKAVIFKTAKEANLGKLEVVKSVGG
jgi:hypothetical protein